MYKLIVTTTLAMVSMAGLSFAQTRADRVFNINDKYIYETHTAHLLDGNRMVVETADVTNYLLVRNLDSIVRLLQHDIGFYKDSVKAPDNVRIDYAMEKDSDKTMLRFKKYQPDGDIYVKRNGELSRMKVEQDTVRIIMRIPVLEHNSHMSFNDFPLQITFLLNNYSDLNMVLEDKGLLNHIIDTFSVESIKGVHSPDIAQHHSSIDYYPYKANKKLVKQYIDNGNERQASLRRKQ